MNSQPSPPNNLPLQLTSLVGRERELAAACELLRRDDVRLLTLTGAPGIGKTRLGIRVASALLPGFAGGAFFVNLAPITDPNLVIPTIAYTLDVRQMGDQSLFQSLKRHLSGRQTLLVLDNFEQVLAAAPNITELLQAATRLKVLITSRELLHLSGEYNFPVPPLSMPPVLTDQGAVRALAHLSSERIAEYEAVQLFAQRAAALNPGFALTESNALIIAGICSRLDGLPLPIELAAARIHHLQPQAILDRLQNRLRLLTGGTQDLPARQRTLRATIDWSYNLLDEDEQRLFRRLAVFQGGGTLTAIEAVCDADGDLGTEPLDGVTSLVDKSLVRPELGERVHGGAPEPEGVAAEPYFTMLETVHEYAREQLDASGETALMRRYHSSYFLALAHEAEPQLHGPQQVHWLNTLERERDNLRAALDWTFHNDVALGLRLAAMLGTFWTRRGHLTEGQEWLSRMLTGVRDAGMPPTKAVAHALYSLGFITWHRGDLQDARSLLQESVTILKELQKAGPVDKKILAEALNILGIVTGRLAGIPARRPLHEEALEVASASGDEWSVARSLYQLGHVGRVSGEYEQAQALFIESLALFRASGDDFNVGLALIGAGLMAQQRGDYAAARALFEESLAINRALGVSWAVASVLYCLGSVALDQGDYAGAREFLDESIAGQRELGTRGDIAEGLENLGRAAYFQGDYAASHAYYAESLTLFQEVGDKYGIALCLMDLAGVMIALGSAAKATGQRKRGGPEEEPRAAVAESGARLLGAAQALFERIGIQLNQMGQKLFDIYVSDARRKLGEERAAREMDTGRAMDVESAIALAQGISMPLEPVEAATPGSARPTASPLTRREREIAVLIANGQSNRQIADALVMSERTVEWHASNILSRLGFQSRAQIARWAAEQGLVAPSP